MTDKISKPNCEKKIAVLGSTGSVGRQTLDVSEKCGAAITAISASSSVKGLEEQIRKFHPKLALLRVKRLDVSLEH